MYELRRKIIVNFLHHVKGKTIQQAENIYIENLKAFDVVFDLVGEDIMVDVLKKVNRRRKV